MFLNALFMAIDTKVLLKAIEILWQGLLAMVVVIGVIIIVTYIVQNLAERASLAKRICEKEKEQKRQEKQLKD